MHTYSNTSSNQVKHLSGKKVRRFDNKAWAIAKKPQYEWAWGEGRKYKGSVAATLQAVVACCNENGKGNPSIKAIAKMRAKVIPGKPLCERTIANHLRILSVGKSIRRGLQKAWNATVRTVLAIKKKLSRPQHEKNSNLYLNSLKGDLDNEQFPPPYGGGEGENMVSADRRTIIDSLKDILKPKKR